MDWQPDAGEIPLFRGRVSFATGKAGKVAGMRWFRDEQGVDIGALIPGWPAGPEFRARRDETVKAKKFVGTAAKVTKVTVVGILDFINSGTGPLIEVSGPGPEDPAMEVEDFPVMGASAGSIAWTLPWVMDPGRRRGGYYTELQLTDRRLVVVGYVRLGQPGEVLWEAALDRVAGVRQHAYGLHDGDLTVRFVDGSWVRLDFEGPGRAAKVAWVLGGNLEPVVLNEAQRAHIFRPRYAECVIDCEAIPVPDAPAGTVSFEFIIRFKNGRVHNFGVIALGPDGKQVPRGAAK